MNVSDAAGKNNGKEREERRDFMNLLASGVNSFYGGYGYGGYGYMFDWTYLLIIAGLVLSLIASSNVKSTFNH